MNLLELRPTTAEKVEQSNNGTENFIKSNNLEDSPNVGSKKKQKITKKHRNHRKNKGGRSKIGQNVSEPQEEITDQKEVSEQADQNKIKIKK